MQIFNHRISQNNFFTKYHTSNSDYKKIKKQIINYGIELKVRISQDNRKIKDLLNNVAIRIQKRVNNGNLTRDNINSYRQEFQRFTDNRLFRRFF